MTIPWHKKNLLKAGFNEGFIKALTAGAIISSAATLAACRSSVLVYDITQLNPDARGQQGGLCSIYAISTNLAGLPLIRDPAHTGLIFCNSGVPAFQHFGDIGTLDGVAFDRQTLTPKALGGSGDALIVINEYKISKGQAITTEIFCAPCEEVFRKYMIALDAAHFINCQNLNYDAIHVLTPAQNCNSVAATLIAAMGLEFPRKNRAHMLPGLNRHLLPRGWRSYYQDWTPPANDREFLSWYADKMVFEISHPTHCLPNPEDTRPRRYDPENPYAAYEPLIVKNAWENYCKANESLRGHASELSQIGGPDPRP